MLAILIYQPNKPTPDNNSNLDNNTSVLLYHQKLEAKRKEIKNLEGTIITK